MKKILILLTTVIWASACSTDFELTSKYKEVMVVYGLLNQSEQDHYLRIHKGYQDKDESALKFAVNPDSIYYPDILDVTITEMKNGQALRQWTLERIDGDTLNPPIVKDSGTFVRHPNILYHFRASLNPDFDYELKIVNTKSGKVVRSSTGLVGDFNVQFPNSRFAIPWTAPNQYRINWSNAKNSKIYDLNVLVHYSLADVSKPTQKVRQESFYWTVFRNKVFNTTEPLYVIPFENFLQAVKTNLNPDPSVVRYLDSLDFTFTVGTPDFADYINFSIARSGITQDQISTGFTNIEGGYGIFSARYDKTITGVRLNNQSLDSLACGSKTGDLQFAPSGPTAYPSWPFCD